MKCSGHRRRGVHRLEPGRRAARARRRGDGRRRPLDRPPRATSTGRWRPAPSWSSSTSATPPRWRALARERGPRRSSTWPPRSTSASRSPTPPSTPRSTSAAPPTCSRRPARAGRGRVVFVSTGGAIYGEGEGQQLPLDEDAPIAPLSAYGQSKFAAEGYLALYERLYGLSSVALRLGNVYGPRQDPLGEAGVIAIFCGLLQRRRAADRLRRRHPDPRLHICGRRGRGGAGGGATRRRPARSTSAPGSRPTCSSWPSALGRARRRRELRARVRAAARRRGAADHARRRRAPSASWAGAPQTSLDEGLAHSPLDGRSDAARPRHH